MPVELKYTRERLLELLIGQRVTDHHDDDIHNIIIA